MTKKTKGLCELHNIMDILKKKHKWELWLILKDRLIYSRLAVGFLCLTYGTHTTNGTEILISGSSFSSDGNPHVHFPEYDRPETGHGVVHDGDGEAARSIFARHGRLFRVVEVARLFLNFIQFKANSKATAWVGLKTRAELLNLATIVPERGGEK